jgi:peptidoglycan/LPS O-acetylase OafA/YrhL
LSNIQSERLKRNNFDLLRLIFAGIVCLIHAYQLSGFEQLAVFTQFLSSDVAVKAFFIVSGFLIFMSYERSTSLRSYAEKRIRRIYPAYFAVIVLCAFGLVLATEKSALEYFSGEWVRYVAANLVFLNTLQPTLPGVFQSNNIAAVDGALWTLKIEAMFYVAVPLIALSFKKFGRLRMIVLVYALSVTYSLVLNLLAECILSSVASCLVS